jgi:tetratricopeptide (TPR) repeat protein
MDCYALAIKKDRSVWLWNFYLGFLKREMGESEEAVAAFSEVVRINPKAYHAFYYMGQGLQDLSRYDEAEKAYRNIVSLKQKRTCHRVSSGMTFFPWVFM